MKQLFVLLLSFGPAWLCAQRVQDVEFWHSISFNKELSKRWSLSLNPQLRLDENVSQIKNHIISLAAGYELAKWYTVSPSLRYTFRNSANAARLFLDNSFRWDLGNSDFRVNCRVRLQTDKIFDSRRDWTYTARLRPQLVWKPSQLKHWGFTLASFEAFFSNRTGAFEYYRFRASAGFSYEINKNTEIGFNYITQLQPFTAGAQRDHIGQLSFQMNFERSKKKDKKDKDKNDGKKDKDKKDKKEQPELD